MICMCHISWISHFLSLLTTQEIVWQIVNDLDLETVKRKTASERIPFLEIATVVPKGVPRPPHVADPIAHADRLPTDRPRVIKSHLTLEHLPPKLLDTCKGDGSMGRSFSSTGLH